MLASYGLFDGELPPTLADALWHGGFSAKRNPFAFCYYAKRFQHFVSQEEEKRACEYLKQFGRTREEQARHYYLWAQTVPKPFWRYFSLLSLSDFGEIVADMVPPLAVANLLRHLDLYSYFRDAVVLDMFSGVCGWLMAFMFLPSHYLPRRWVAVDIDGKRLQICRLICARFRRRCTDSKARPVQAVCARWRRRRRGQSAVPRVLCCDSIETAAR